MKFVPTEPIHPGEILRQDFLEEYGISPEQAASDTGIAPDLLVAIAAGHETITAAVALRLSRYFETSPEFWLNLQRSYDLGLALKTVDDLEKITPVRAA